MKQRSLYFLYLVAVTAVWLYVQFPARAIQAYAVQKAAALTPGLSMAVEAVNLSFPLGVRFDEVALSYQGAPALNLDWLELHPGWKSLMPGQAAFAFQSALGEGKVLGRIEMVRGPDWKPKFLHLDLEAVSVADLPILAQQTGRKITGICSGEIVCGPEDAAAEAKAHLVLENGRVEIRQPVIKRESLEFARVDAQIEVQRRSVALRRIVWQGPEIDGEFSGTVEIKSPLETSRIEIRGDLRPHAGFLTELGQTIPERLLPKPGPGGRYAVQLAGTVAKPHYRWR